MPASDTTPLLDVEAREPRWARLLTHEAVVLFWMVGFLVGLGAVSWGPVATLPGDLRRAVVVAIFLGTTVVGLVPGLLAVTWRLTRAGVARFHDDRVVIEKPTSWGAWTRRSLFFEDLAGFDDSLAEAVHLRVYGDAELRAEHAVPTSDEGDRRRVLELLDARGLRRLEPGEPLPGRSAEPLAIVAPAPPWWVGTVPDVATYGSLLSAGLVLAAVRTPEAGIVFAVVGLLVLSYEIAAYRYRGVEAKGAAIFDDRVLLTLRHDVPVAFGWSDLRGYRDRGATVELVPRWGRPVRLAAWVAREKELLLRHLAVSDVARL